MPLKLTPPRLGKTPYYYVRGTHHGVSLDRSTKTADRAKAQRFLKKWEADIESGQLSSSTEPTFIDASVAYIQASGNDAFLKPIVDQIGNMALSRIKQANVDALATELYPNASPATRNRQVYTPVSAVLKHYNIDWEIKRPKGWRGKKAVTWLRKEEAFAILDAAEKIEPEFRLFCTLLLYTGLRLSEALRIRLRDVHLDEGTIYIPRTKNEDPRQVYLPPVLLAEFASQPPRIARPLRGAGPALKRGATGKQITDAGVPFMDRAPDAKLFRFTKGSFLNKRLTKAKEAAGVDLPKRQGGFHVFRHTWATWMRRYAAMDTSGLVETGAWKDRSSAARYEHTTVSEEARKADLLPAPPNRGQSVEPLPKARKS